MSLVFLLEWHCTYVTSLDLSGLTLEVSSPLYLFFFFNDTATTEIYTLSLHDALPISVHRRAHREVPGGPDGAAQPAVRGRRGNRLLQSEGRSLCAARAVLRGAPDESRGVDAEQRRQPARELERQRDPQLHPSRRRLEGHHRPRGAVGGPGAGALTRDRARTPAGPEKHQPGLRDQRVRGEHPRTHHRVVRPRGLAGRGRAALALRQRAG